MKKYTGINLLVLNDEDMNCGTPEKGIAGMSLEDIGFSMLAIEKYDMVIYEGKKGSKILKSRYTKKGEIK